MLEEEWREITGYEGMYEISNFGRVRSQDKLILREGTSKPYIHKGRILKPQTVSTNKTIVEHKPRKGYKQVALTNNGKAKFYYIHRLVANEFVYNEDPEKYNEVNHIDEDTFNNKADNLEWTTRNANMNHGTRNKRISEKNMGNSKRAEFFTDGIPTVRYLKNQGISIQLSRRYKTDFSNNKITLDRLRAMNYFQKVTGAIAFHKIYLELEDLVGWEYMMDYSFMDNFKDCSTKELIAIRLASIEIK